MSNQLPQQPEVSQDCEAGLSSTPDSILESKRDIKQSTRHALV